MDFFQLNDTRFLESSPDGQKWKVMIIEEGLSKNGKYYTAEALQNAAHLFEKSPVRFYEFRKNFFTHLPLSLERMRPEGFPLQTAGFLENVKYETVNLDGRQRTGLTGILNFLDTQKANEIRETLASAWKKGIRNLLGLSINADGEPPLIRMMNGIPIAIVNAIKSVISTDIVTQPAAGGGLLKLIESDGLSKLIEDVNNQGGIHMNFKKLLESLKAWKSKLFENVDIANITLEEAVGILQTAIKESKDHKAFASIEKLPVLMKESKFEEADQELAKILEAEKALNTGDDAARKAQEAKAAEETARKAQEAKAAEDARKNQEAAQKAKDLEVRQTEAEKKLAEIEKKAALTECKATLTTKLSESKLPKPCQDKIRKQFENRIFEDVALENVIKEERTMLAKLAESNSAFDFGEGEGVFIQSEPVERLQASMDLMVGYQPTDEDKKNYEGIEGFKSLKEAYIAFTDDPNVSGNIGPKARQRLQEADATTFNYALGFSMQRRMLRDYRLQDPQWKKLAVSVPVKDFKLQERIRWGGFGIIPTVQAARTVAGTPIDSETPTYPELGFPTDQEATYAVMTKGGIVTVTRRMIIDDDLNVLSKLVGKLGRAASNTLNRFVFDLFLNVSAGTINGGTISDSIALYATAHKNYRTGAMGFDNLRILLDDMFHQVEFGNQTLAASGSTFDSDAAATTVNVTTGTGQYFKAGDMLWCEGEILSVSSVSTDALTVVRGLFGTTAATHADGVTIYKVTEILGLQNPYLWVPRSLRSTALALKNSEFNPEAAEREVNTIRDSFDPIVSTFLRGDENNYYLSAKTSDIEGMEVGFLNGREEPEILVQDQPTVGNVFTYDTIRYKVRHEYGGAVTDFRAFAGSIVS